GTQQGLVLTRIRDGGADRVRVQADLLEQRGGGDVREGARGAVVVGDAEHGRGDDLAAGGGERALEDHPGAIHLAMDREHLTARNTREDAIAHPVQDRVERAEEVDVRPVGARVIVERGAEAAVSDVGAGGQAQRLLHPARTSAGAWTTSRRPTSSTRSTPPCETGRPGWV